MDGQPGKKYCLLIVQQSFHSFAGYLKDALIAKGFEVDVANDIYPIGIMGSIMGKLQIPLVFTTTYRHIKKTFLNDKKYELAVIIRGRGVNEKLIKEISKTVPCIIGYNWDTFDFNAAPLAWYRDVDKYYTFDYADASKYHIPVLELFSAMPAPTGAKAIKYDICAIGKNYPGRLKYIHRVLGVLKPQRALISLHENNVFDLLRNFCANPLLYLKYRKYISLAPLNDAAYLDAIGAAEFTIDYANKGQTGITMRCYEAISLQTRLISNNAYITRSACFNQNNTMVFGETEPDTVLTAAYNRCKQTVFIKSHRGINEFINELLA
nr:hypothetical protein [uncultured Mucilaginibacter sp.]